ncbi:MAG: hypothetical protein IPO31_18325 [Candidatus Obscuribacter sp.]|nr:hypothetical protein [Candidatus Obscuribacter sp.]
MVILQTVAWVMSALAQFNGRPEVTRSGFIVYIFPDYLSTAPSTLVLPDSPPASR